MLGAVDSGRLVAALEPCGHVPASVAIRFVDDLGSSVHSPQLTRLSTPTSLPSLISPSPSIPSVEGPRVRPATPFNVVAFLPNEDYIPELAVNVLEACIVVSHDKNPRNFAVRIINGRTLEHPSDIEMTVFCSAFIGVPVSTFAGYPCILELKLDPENPGFLATPPEANVYFRQEEVAIRMRDLHRIATPSAVGPFQSPSSDIPPSPDSAHESPAGVENSGLVASDAASDKHSDAVKNSPEPSISSLGDDGFENSAESHDHHVGPVESFYTGIIAPSITSGVIDHVDVTVSTFLSCVAFGVTIPSLSPLLRSLELQNLSLQFDR
jgi:hypothetical protein